MTRRRHLIVGLAVVAAVAVAVPVFAVQKGVSGPTKKAIKNEVAKQIAKAIGPTGLTGLTGPPGATGLTGPAGIAGTPGSRSTRTT